jgi:citrate synthase
MKLSDNKATLSFSNGSPSVDLPVYQGNIGPDVVDIRKLYAQTGMFTYDPGFLSHGLMPVRHHLYRWRQG